MRTLFRSPVGKVKAYRSVLEYIVVCFSMRTHIYAYEDTQI